MPADQRVVCGNGSPIHIRGQVQLTLSLQGMDYVHTFHVSDDNIRGILGADFLERYHASLDMGRRKLALDDRLIELYDVNGAPKNHRAVVNASVVLPPKQQGILWVRVHGREAQRVDDTPVLIGRAVS